MTQNSNRLKIYESQNKYARAKGYSLEHDRQHGLEHLVDWALHYLSQGEDHKAGGLLIAAKELLSEKKNPMQIKVETFMEACEQEVKKYPELTTEEVRNLRIRLMTSELLGYNGNGLPIHHVLIYGLIEDKSNELVASLLAGDLVGIADGIGDLLYVVFGTAAAYGINIQEVFDEIHRSNMSKTVWNEDIQTYTVIKDEGGKVLKPEGYSPANIATIINRQIEAGKTA